jgi:hypothetical protein
MITTVKGRAPTPGAILCYISLGIVVAASVNGGFAFKCHPNNAMRIFVAIFVPLGSQACIYIIFVYICGEPIYPFDYHDSILIQNAKASL